MDVAPACPTAAVAAHWAAFVELESLVLLESVPLSAAVESALWSCVSGRRNGSNCAFRRSMKSVDWNIDESWFENVSMRLSAKRTANLGW